METKMAISIGNDKHKVHHITCDLGTIEQRACMLSDMILLDVSGGGIIHEYTDIGLSSIYREYKSILGVLITDQK